MKYKIVFRKKAEKALYLVNSQDFLAVAKIIDSLEKNPWPEGSSSVVGTDYLRIRVRRYRIIYEVDSKKGTVRVERIARRNEQTYKNL